MDLYDTIGRGYGQLRRQDPRIAAHIFQALEGSSSVVNVGAGAGSYEPRDRKVVAVEPSMVMIRQRRSDAAPTVRASATNLPFRDEAFDASLAVLTIHHWPDLDRGLHELRRAARRNVIILTCDPSVTGFWLTDYFPEILEIDRRILPSLSKLRRHPGTGRICLIRCVVVRRLLTGGAEKGPSFSYSQRRKMSGGRWELARVGLLD